MHKFKIKYWLPPLVLLLGLTAAVKGGFLSFSQAADKTASKPATAITVTVSPVQQVTKVSKLALTGSIEGETSAVISAKISGRIEQVLVQEGQEVSVGQPLVRLESIELANQVRTAQDAVRKAQVNYDNAQADFNRYQTLFQQAAISRQQLDSAEMRLKVAQADLSSAQAALSSAEQQHAYAVVTAPVAGVVANKTATVGQVVAGGLTLMTVEDIRNVYAVVNIEQKDMGTVTAGLPAEITVDAYGSHVFKGAVDIINPAAGNGSRSFKTKLKIDNEGSKLKPGMFVKVQLITGKETTVPAVLQAAVYQKQGLYYVYVLEGEKAVRRQVEVGAVLGDCLEVKTGITVGTPVITSNVNKLKDGDTVSVAK